MNGKIFTVIGMLVSAGVGFAAGYYVAKDRSEKAAEKEIDEMRQYYTLKTAPEAHRRPENPPLEELRRKYASESQTGLAGASEASERASYEVIKKDYIPEDDDEWRENEDGDEEEEETEENEEEYTMSSKRDPKLISADEFGEDPDFETQELYYYQESDVLTNEDDDPIVGEGRDDTVGVCLVKYDFIGNAEGDVFIRNFEHGVDYHVKKIFGYYAD